MHETFLQAESTPGLFKFPLDANGIKVLVGIEKRCQQELLPLMAENGNAINQPNSWLLCCISVRNFWRCAQRH